MVEAARAAGLEPTLVLAAAEHLDRAIERGHGDEDMATACFAFGGGSSGR